MLNAGRLRHYSPGQHFYFYGDEPDGIYGIADGNVRLAAPSDSGEEMMIQLADTGYWIGDLALFAQQTRLVTIIATSDVQAMFVSRDHLREIFARNPDHIRYFYELTHFHFSTTLRLLANAAVSGSEKRLGLRLLLADEQVREADGWLQISQEQLAVLAGVSLPTLQRILKRLSAAKLVELGYGRLRVTNREGLLELCQT